MTQDPLQRTLKHIDQNQTQAIDRLKELIAIPSISTLPEHQKDCDSAAQWLKHQLEPLGFEVSIHPTHSHPIIKADYTASTGSYVVFYGHYDVQPVDPISQWHHPPFEGKIKDMDGKKVITGRGASDDKGQMMTFIEACRAFIHETGSLPCSVTCILEGDEENDPSAISTFLKTHKPQLENADCLLICDTQNWNEHTPAITTSLRGLVAYELTLSGPASDLHSGMYGGVIQNPLQVLCQLLGSIHDRHGHVLIPGFYDDIHVPETLRNQARQLPFSPDSLLEETGAQAIWGEPNHSIAETLWFLPTFEVNGIIGGHIGDGCKTIIPSVASAKITCRLAPGQQPMAITTHIEQFLKQHCPSGTKLTLKSTCEGMPGLAINPDHQLMYTIQNALNDEWQARPALIGFGGSIPATIAFHEILNIDCCMLIGFASRDDNIHAPNEHFGLSTFHRGTRSWARILWALGLPS
ncbi:MAG: M20/M25/M40 family metallo-hydrolase [Pseudomonadota bacterium]|nr:M20/M25/M40 family metallo-hydrolase [Pseudomonadota bacterium]